MIRSLLTKKLVVMIIEKTERTHFVVLETNVF